MKSNMPPSCPRQSGSRRIPLTTEAPGTHPWESGEPAEPALTSVQREPTLAGDKEKRGSSPGLSSGAFVLSNTQCFGARCYRQTMKNHTPDMSPASKYLLLPCLNSEKVVDTGRTEEVRNDVDDKTWIHVNSGWDNQSLAQQHWMKHCCYGLSAHLAMCCMCW